jgi:hypothetical protein
MAMAYAGDWPAELHDVAEDTEEVRLRRWLPWDNWWK